MGKHSPTSIGHEAETATSDYLCAHGLQILTRNYRCKQGELDLIAKEGNTLVFVEVRYRKTTTFGDPLETVDRKKQSKLVSAAQVYLSQHPAASKLAARFDVVSVTGDPRHGNINWIKNAFGA